MRLTYREAPHLLDTIRRNMGRTLGAFLPSGFTVGGILTCVSYGYLHRAEAPPPTPSTGSGKILAITVADLGHSFFSAEMMALAIVTPIASGTPLPTAFFAPDTVMGQSLSISGQKP